MRRLRRRGLEPIYCPSSRVLHRIEPERTTQAALLRRSFQYGSGTARAVGLPEASLLKKSRAVWLLRIASNLGIGACQLLAGALEPDAHLRFTRLFSRTNTFSKNFEARRWAAQMALSRRPGLSGQLEMVLQKMNARAEPALVLEYVLRVAGDEQDVQLGPAQQEPLGELAAAHARQHHIGQQQGKRRFRFEQAQ